MHESEVSSENGHRNFPGQTTSGITERRRSPKPTWEGPEKLSCKCDLPPTWLPLGCQQQVHPREEESEAGATFPANGMQNPGRRERPGKTWSSVPLGDESLPGSKGFPISLNGALIVIPRARVESEMAVPLNAITSSADSFQLANDALMVDEVVSNICYRYSVFYSRAL